MNTDRGTDNVKDENGNTKKQKQSLANYSSRRATNGSILVARWAGMKQASNATEVSRAAMEMNDTGSVGLTA
jgi:hypothetical protein